MTAREVFARTLLHLLREDLFSADEQTEATDRLYEIVSQEKEKRRKWDARRRQAEQKGNHV